MNDNIKKSDIALIIISFLFACILLFLSAILITKIFTSISNIAGTAAQDSYYGISLKEIKNNYGIYVPSTLIAPVIKSEKDHLVYTLDGKTHSVPKEQTQINMQPGNKYTLIVDTATGEAITSQNYKLQTSPGEVKSFTEQPFQIRKATDNDIPLEMTEYDKVHSYIVNCNMLGKYIFKLFWMFLLTALFIVYTVVFFRRNFRKDKNSKK